MFAFLSVILASELRASAAAAPVDIGPAGTSLASSLWIDRFIDASDELWTVLNCSPGRPPSLDPNIRMPQLAQCVDQTPPPKVPDPATTDKVVGPTLRLIEVLEDPANTADPQRVAELKASLYALLFRFGV